MPLTITGGPCSSSKCVNNNSTESKYSSTEDLKSSTEDTVKITSSRANASNEINNHKTQEEIVKDLEVNSYKEVMLKEPN